MAVCHSRLTHAVAGNHQFAGPMTAATFSNVI